MLCILDYPCADYPVDLLSAHDLKLLTLIMNMANQVIWDRVLEQNPQSKQQGRQGTYESNSDAHSRNDCCLAKTNITYSEYLSVHIVIQHTRRMRHIILSSVTCLVVLNFSHYLINKTIFRKKNY